MTAKTAAAKTTAQKTPALTIERVFDAPRAAVFRAWTDPALLKRWWAPAGCSTPHCTVDLRPGGLFHYCMRLPDGKDIWGRGVYQEVAAPERLSYLDSFADERGNRVSPTRYGMSAEHPNESARSRSRPTTSCTARATAASSTRAAWSRTSSGCAS